MYWCSCLTEGNIEFFRASGQNSPLAIARFGANALGNGRIYGSAFGYAQICPCEQTSHIPRTLSEIAGGRVRETIQKLYDELPDSDLQLKAGNSILLTLISASHPNAKISLNCGKYFNALTCSRWFGGIGVGNISYQMLISTSVPYIQANLLSPLDYSDYISKSLARKSAWLTKSIG